MTALEASSLPSGVQFDIKGKKGHKKKQKFQHKFRLQFNQRCPDVAEVRKLHPSIRVVFVPRRPPSIRYCILKFVSAKACAEVRSALHGKHIEPFKGVLKCSDTTSHTISKLTGLKSEDVAKVQLTKGELKHLKIVSKPKSTVDVKCNSTARELFVRYGITSGIQSGKEDDSRL